jgi:Ca2+-binding EF-hand superfamily protein
MRDFDKLRSGYITDAQFRIGLNMGKVVLSSGEFELLCAHYQAPKEGRHVRWRDFCDDIESVFTKKGLEKNVDLALGDARLATSYGLQGPSLRQQALAEEVVEGFRDLLIKNRLDAKSFFQDWDHHRHFKISLKQFRQVLSNFGFIISDEQAQACVKVFGNPAGEVEYLRFLEHADPAKVLQQPIERGPKPQYTGKETNFLGSQETVELMQKIKTQVKKDRIRLLEFFQDHDILRKGYLPQQKFRSTLHSQKLFLTEAEYSLLQKVFAAQIDAQMVDYVRFNVEIENIFTDKFLEKDPLKTVTQFKASSILDPKDVLNAQEEQELDAALIRIGTEVRHKRLLIKPFFQDKDKSKSSFIATSRFRSIFDMLHLKLTDREFQLIGKRFQAKAENEINYVEFDHVLKRYSGDDQPV